MKKNRMSNVKQTNRGFTWGLCAGLVVVRLPMERLHEVAATNLNVSCVTGVSRMVQLENKSCELSRFLLKVLDSNILVCFHQVYGQHLNTSIYTSCLNNLIIQSEDYRD